MKSTTEYCEELYQLEFLKKIINNSQLVNFEISRYTHNLRLQTTAPATRGSRTADSTRKVSNNPNPNLAQHTTRTSSPPNSKLGSARNQFRNLSPCSPRQTLQPGLQGSRLILAATSFYKIAPLLYRVCRAISGISEDVLLPPR